MGDRPRRILVADDEVVVRMVIERLFARRPGDAATVVATTDDAVEAIEREPFDIVVTDIRMPDGGGVLIARAARERGIPVVFITGFADSGEVQEFLDDGVPVVRKPFSPDQLLDAIAHVLGAAPGDPPAGGGPAPAAGS